MTLSPNNNPSSIKSNSLHTIRIRLKRTEQYSRRYSIRVTTSLRRFFRKTRFRANSYSSAPGHSRCQMRSWWAHRFYPRSMSLDSPVRRTRLTSQRIATPLTEDDGTKNQRLRDPHRRRRNRRRTLKQISTHEHWSHATRQSQQVENTVNPRIEQQNQRTTGQERTPRKRSHRKGKNITQL